MSRDRLQPDVKPDKVAIVGAGVAGCAMAGALMDYGINFEVFERNDRAGGLWTDNYPGARVQSTFELYEFPGKRFPESIRNRKDPPAPTASEVCTYLDEYIAEKNMKNRFRFNSNIVLVMANSPNDWVLEFDDGRAKSFQYVIFCNGLVSVKPNKIQIPGMDDFQWNGGVVIHSSERRFSDNWFHGQRVIIIGNGKSATDAMSTATRIYTETKEGGKDRDSAMLLPPIQVARRQTWYIPRYIRLCCVELQYKWIFHTRLGSAMLPTYYECRNWFKILLHFLLLPLKFIVWRILELVLLVQYRLPSRLWPAFGSLNRTAVEVSVTITDDHHLQALRSGAMDLRIDTVERLEAQQAVLSSGQVEPVDVVILATGWKLGFDTFIDDSSVLSRLDYEEDGLWLYRNILPAGHKGCAFVGSNTLTFMNIYTSYIQAYWLAQLLAGERPWPDAGHMAETVEREKAWKRRLYPESVLRAASIEGYMQHYHDVLFREMNARKPSHGLLCCFGNLLKPVLPATMQGTLEPQRETKAI